MSAFNHHAIVAIYEVVCDTQYIHLVMELCRGGELFDLIYHEKTISEEYALNCIRYALETPKETFSTVWFTQAI